ncbi:actin cytoskeleton-regulatory complex protein pan1-like [Vanessa atalanta]|uniref:actin cytoskeleton-regulatory complex protein pan1-like n=1 Tax=Vanessa atalanta TaxID=42275 RepID=UPI001FCCFEC0|nr:actin cytoskeleton-regulatory complex protein pan1-like [Vanessa atalanta]
METASDASVRFVDHDDSDSDSDSARLTADRRGNSKNGLSQARAVLKKKEEEDRELAFERTLRSRAFKKAPAAAPVVHEPTPTINIADPADLSAEELCAEAGRNAAQIREVALKSSNLKGGFIKKLKDAATSLEGVVEALASRTEAEESRRLRADNNRLHREVENLKAELKAHRREYAEMRTTVAAATEAANTPRGAPSMEELKDFIVRSIGDEGPIDKPQEVTLSHAPADRQPAIPKKARKTAPPVAQSPTAGPPCATVSAPVAPATSQTPPNKETSWSTVVKKGRKGSKTTPSADATAAKAPPKTPQPAKSKLATPRSAAIVLTLQPEAVGKGVTYALVLERAEQSVKLQDLGISGGLKVRRTATGARALELPKAQAEQADRLAAKLRTVLDGVADVVRPVKKADLKVTGLDDSVTLEKLAAAIAHAGDCSSEAVKCGVMQRGPGYMGMVRVTCPLTAAKKLAAAGRLLVGWSSAKVAVVEQRPMRCYKCGEGRPVLPLWLGRPQVSGMHGQDALRGLRGGWQAFRAPDGGQGLQPPHHEG